MANPPPIQTPETPGIAAKTMRSALWLIARFGARQGANTVAFFLIAALITPEEFGLGAIAVAIGAVLRQLVYRGLRDVVIQSKTLDETNYSTALWLNTGLGLVLASCLVSGFWLGSVLFELNTWSWPFLLAALIPLLSAPSAIQEAQLERDFRHVKLTFAQAIASCLAAVISVGIALLGAGAIAVVLLRVLEFGFVAVVTAYLGKRHLVFGLHRDLAVNQLRQATPISLNALLTGSYVHLVVIIVGGILGTSAAAMFRIALQVYNLLTQLFLAPLNQALLPAFARYKGDAIGHRYCDAVTILGLVAFPAFVGAGFVAEPVFEVLLGANWFQAGSLTLIVVLASLFIIPVTALEPALISIQRAQSAALLNGAGILLGSGFITLGATQGGLEGAAAGFVMRGLILYPVVLLVAKHDLTASLSSQICALLYPLIATAFMAAVLFSTREQFQALHFPALLVIALYILLGAATYALAALILGWVGFSAQKDRVLASTKAHTLLARLSKLMRRHRSPKSEKT